LAIQALISDHRSSPALLSLGSGAGIDSTIGSVTFSVAISAISSREGVGCFTISAGGLTFSTVSRGLIFLPQRGQKRDSDGSFWPQDEQKLNWSVFWEAMFSPQ
jgi:hypothetical protein